MTVLYFKPAPAIVAGYFFQIPLAGKEADAINTLKTKPLKAMAMAGHFLLKTAASSKSLVPILKATEQISRSEEHTSELQSREKLVCRLLLEKKKEKSLNQTS